MSKVQSPRSNVRGGNFEIIFETGVTAQDELGPRFKARSMLPEIDPQNLWKVPLADIGRWTLDFGLSFQ